MKLLLLILVLSFSPFALAITPEDVVGSSLVHFPKVIESMKSLEETEQSLRSSRGSFDAKIKGEMDTRTEGFYGGDAYKASIEKPIPYFNSKIYAGKRQSYGQFPGYEGKYETLDEGEFFAGASISLLRNSLIDETRYLIRMNEQFRDQAEHRLELTKISVQTMALKAYWAWMIKGHELKVYQNILGLARSRDTQIKARVRAGDLARIYRSENLQYIRKREAQVVQSQMEFQKASYYLSLFYRNGQGKPIPLSLENLPALEKKILSTVMDHRLIFQKARDKSLDIKILKSMAEQNKLDISLGTNEILPKVDVNFEWNQDQGFGPNRLQQDENRILLNVEVPIEYRKGLGKRRAGKAKLEQTKRKLQLIVEKLNVEVQTLSMKLNSFAEMFTLTNDQVDLAKKLADAERRKFTQGASDLILVNIREENLAEAQVKNLSTLLKYHFVDADIRDVSIDFIEK